MKALNRRKEKWWKSISKQWSQKLSQHGIWQSKCWIKSTPKKQKKKKPLKMNKENIPQRDTMIINMLFTQLLEFPIS